MKFFTLPSFWVGVFGTFLLSLFLAVTSDPVHAACNINLGVRNMGNSIISVSKIKSKVKVKGGLWRALYKGGWDAHGGVKPGGTNEDVYRGAFNCGARRKYQIKYYCKTGPKQGREFVDYYPGSSAWTTKQSLIIPLRRCQ